MNLPQTERNSGKSQFLLLQDRRFLPLFLTQFLGAFHDNLFKNALIVMLLYASQDKMMTGSLNSDPKILVSLAAGIFILPFVLFSAAGGELADKYPKHLVIRALKLTEIALAFCGLAALLTQNIILCFLVLFGLGVQSSLFGPSKYALLPEELNTDELISGNALMNTGAFLAILTGTLAGTLAGTLLMARPHGAIITGGTLILCAATGYLACRLIPKTRAFAPALKITLNPLTEIYRILHYTLTGAHTKNTHAVAAIMGIGWFYFLGALFLSQFPNFTKETLNAPAQTLAFFMAVFSIGIAVGGLLNNKLLGGKIRTTYLLPALLSITIFTLDLAYNGMNNHAAAFTYSNMIAWRITVDIALISISGGLFVVPLNALLQHAADGPHRARILAGNAIISSLFVIASSVFAAILIKNGADIPRLFLVTAILNLPVAVLLSQKIRQNHI